MRDTQNYSTGGASSNLNHDLDYQFDWDDGSLSSWDSSTRPHAWHSTGIYSVRARARCRDHIDKLSAWSQSYSVTVVSNNPSLARSPSSLLFSYPNGLKKFEIWNSGTGTLIWNLKKNSNWMSLFPLNGSSTTERDQVIVTIIWGNISAGETKTDTILVDSNGGKSHVIITASGPNDSLAVIAVFDSPGGSPNGLAWDGGQIWSCDFDKIYKHDANLNVIASYNTPGGNAMWLLSVFTLKELTNLVADEPLKKIGSQ